VVSLRRSQAGQAKEGDRAVLPMVIKAGNKVDPMLLLQVATVDCDLVRDVELVVVAVQWVAEMAIR